MYYVRYWCTAPFLADAPVNDLELWKKFKSLKKTSPKQQGSLPSKFIEFVDAAQTKLDKHLWYLTERNVVFSFFSNKVSPKEKNEMWKKLQKLKNGTDEATIGEGLVQTPEIDENTHLKNLIGRDSLAFLELLPLAKFFLREPPKGPKAWVGTENYKIVQACVEKMQCTNDVAERALGMATSVHNSASVPKDLGSKRGVMQIIQDYRQQTRQHNQSSIQNSSTTTKKFIHSFHWQLS